jgi:hypothetical protein
MKKSQLSPKSVKRNKASSPKLKAKPAPEGMQKVVEEALEKVSSSTEKKYDGVLGMPPSWTPEPEKKRFFEARTALMEQYTEDEIRKLMASQKRTQRKGFTQTLYVPPELEDKIDTLNDFKNLIDLGKTKGMRLILGEERSEHQARGKKVLNAAKEGHAQTHGTKHEKKKRWAKMQTSINKLHRQNPFQTYDWLCISVAEEFNCSKRTIERNTTNPRQK